MAGVGQSWGGTAVTGIQAFLAAAQAANTTLLTLTSQNGVSLVTAWVWCYKPVDASLTNYQLKFGASVVGLVPVYGGPENPPVPVSFQVTGDGATAFTLVNVGATLSGLVAVMFTVLSANAQ